MKVTAQDKKAPFRAVFRLMTEVAELKQNKKDREVHMTRQDRSIKSLQNDLDVSSIHACRSRSNKCLHAQLQTSKKHLLEKDAEIKRLRQDSSQKSAEIKDKSKRTLELEKAVSELLDKQRSLTEALEKEAAAVAAIRGTAMFWIETFDIDMH